MAKKVKKKDLGLGIRALIQNDEQVAEIKTEPVEEITAGIAMVQIKDIHANPNQPRREFDDEPLQELASSIKIHGIIQPLTLRKEDNDSYQIISGERRFRASQLAGLTQVPAYIRVANDQEVMEMALIENIQREDLNPLEVAFTYARLMKEFDLTHEKLAERVGKKRSTVSNFMRLLELPPTVQHALKQQEISTGHAKALQGLRTIDDQLYILNKVINNGLSVRDTESLVRQKITGSSAASGNTKSKASTLPSEYQDIRKNLKSHLGTIVDIKLKGKEKGAIVINFSSVDELNRILDIIED